MTTEVSAGPFAFLQSSALTRLILARGIRVLAIGLGLSVLVSLLAIFAIAARSAQALSYYSGSSYASASGQGADPGAIVGVFVMIVSFVFFTAHLAPFSASASLFGSSVFGVGSLLITGAVVVAAYRAGGQIERRFPYSLSNGESMLRAACIAVPYWVGCLLLFLVSSIHVQSASQNIYQAYAPAAGIGPSALGLLTPLLLVGGSAAIGARRERGSLSPTSGYAVRGIVLALFSMAVGMVASVVGAIIAGLIGILGHAPASGAPSSPLANPGPIALAGGALFALFAALVAVFYIPNGLFWLWGSAFGLNLETAGWLILAFAVAGALLGALTLQSRPGWTEQVSYAITFGVASCLLTFISRPAIGAYELGANPMVVLMTALVVGAILAAIGPSAARTSLGQSALSLGLMRWALRRLPLPGEEVVEIDGFGWSPARPVPEYSDSPRATTVIAAPVVRTQVQAAAVAERVFVPAQPRPAGIRFGKKARIATAVVAVAVVGAVAGNIYLGSVTTPQATASAYEEAVGSNDASAIWSHLMVNEPAVPGAGVAPAQQGVLRLLGENDLKAMLALPQNAHQSRSNISVAGMVQNGDSAMLQVTYQQQSQPGSDTLTLVRSMTEHQFLFYPVWKVAVSPGVLAVNLPAKGSRIAVDGTQLPVDVGNALVWPGVHKITLLASGPFAPTDEIATVQSQAGAQVSFSNMSLTPEARAAAAATVKSHFTSCLQSTNAAVADCPQHLNEYVSTPITWQLVGDPTSDMVATVSPGCQSVMASGHYLMTASYSTEAGPTHRVSGGTYTIPLTWNGQAFQHESQGLGGCGSPSQVQPLPNPGANPATVLAAVQTGWQACLKATVLNPPDCPARAFGYQATSVKWTSTTDPGAGAQVNWDGDTGVYIVTGNYSVVASYEAFGSTEQQPISGPYAAYVTWDGHAATLRYIGQR